MQAKLGQPGMGNPVSPFSSKATAFDEKGASRAGYLSADRTAVWKFEELFKQKAQNLTSESNLSSDAEILYSNITENKSENLNNFSLHSPSKRASMIDDAIKQISNLFAKNIQPHEISIITPVIDDMLKFSLKENLHCNLMYLSGSEKLVQNRFVKAVLTILKMKRSFLSG